MKKYAFKAVSLYIKSTLTNYQANKTHNYFYFGKILGFK